MKLHYFQSFNRLFFVFSVLLLLISGKSLSQTTISTESGTNFTGANGVTGNSAVTFVVQNTNACAITLNQVDVYWQTANTGTIPELWYSATSLGGAPTIATPTWTKIVTAPALTVAANGYLPTFTSLGFSIPAGTTYRFAVQSSNGIRYSGTAGPPSPNAFSANGVNLQVYDFQIAGNVGYGGSFPSPANNPRAFTGRIIFNLAPSVPCTGTPAPGNTLSTATAVCPSQSFTLSLQNNVCASGLTYTWQSAPAAAGPWTNISGAPNLPTYTRTQTATTFYRCLVACGANSATSNPIQVSLNPFSACYCSSGATSPADEDILNVTVGSLNNTSICGAVGPGPGSAAFLYSNYTSGTGAPAAPVLGQGSSVPFSIQVGTCGGNFANSCAIYIDFNQNGAFDVPAERVYLSAATTTGPHFETGNITIPATAVLGITRMRVINAETAPANIVPCGNINGTGGTGWGETEDYNVNIVSCIAGSFSGQPASSTISCGQNTSFTIAASGTGVTYQWQESVGGGPFANITNGGVYSGATSTTLTLTGVPPTFNGNQYRCVITGTCTPATNSNAVTLTVTQPPAPGISPAPPVSACLGAPIAINITTAGGFGAPVVTSATQTHPAPGLTCANACNTSSTVSIGGIPAGAVITQARVTINMNHTWISDMVINLRAPNGNILNLFNGDGTNGDNMVNTVISSAGVTGFAAGTPPYTGTFAPKASNAVGPTGNVSNVTNFSGLYSAPNGTWTLVLQDLFSGDDPFLLNWTLELTYTPIIPVQGTWTPTAGLFTNAGGTIPYTGGLASTVYAAPGASTTYSVNYTVAGCTSPSTSVPVTVNTPVSITTQPVNRSVCTDRTTTFTVAATGTNPSYQWQVNPGTGFVNVTNGANYAGATTNTLSVINPPVGWNTYQYRVVVNGVAPCTPVNSNAVTLTVFNLPVVTVSAAPYTRLFPGLRTTLTTSSTPAAVNYLWARNGITIAGASGPTYVADISGLGDYRVTVTDINGCINSSNLFTIDDSVSSRVFIYPSPNTGQFQVRFHSLKGNSLPRMLTIFNEKGQKVMNQVYTIGSPYQSMNVDLRNHGKGVYRVELSDRSGLRLATGTVIVL